MNPIKFFAFIGAFALMPLFGGISKPIITSEESASSFALIPLIDIGVGLRHGSDFVGQDGQIDMSNALHWMGA